MGAETRANYANNKTVRLHIYVCVCAVKVISACVRAPARVPLGESFNLSGGLIAGCATCRRERDAGTPDEVKEPSLLLPLGFFLMNRSLIRDFLPRRIYTHTDAECVVIYAGGKNRN